jgi:Predicted transcriptional regulators
MKCADLARKIGVTRQSIAAVERGLSPSPDLSKKIVEALGIEFDDVFSIESD